MVCPIANDADLNISLKMHKKLSFWIFTTICHIYMSEFCLYFKMSSSNFLNEVTKKDKKRET